jgi:hypothetical protein
VLGSLPVEVQRAVLDLLEDGPGTPDPKPSEEPRHPNGLVKPHAEVAHPDVSQHRPVGPSQPDLLSDRTRIPITGMEAVELGEASHEDPADGLPGCRDAIAPRSHGRVPLGVIAPAPHVGVPGEEAACGAQTLPSWAGRCQGADPPLWVLHENVMG